MTADTPEPIDQDCVVCSVPVSPLGPHPKVCARHRIMSVSLGRRDGTSEPISVDEQGRFTNPVKLESGEWLSVTYEDKEPSHAT